ncbi:phosphatidylinositol-4-phosphate-5-kinase (Pi-PIPK-D8/GPCR-PIPK) [Thraustotheca clavata]|uniref:Phosphatidylinositol-4-phosphate-5-kinase (Pi-PIPK-D8/GPCR-PIPK) n=1 Tax=Thraustotheca clavata TaxID=74557 RepID=A0A1V9ZD92_9STRA|nr:phosphatidylinositol-4-phosphate-5-kinase (Pi-PIPK-D8/GPCR-PIPK) [Thraustotheca clavata]
MSNVSSVGCTLPGPGLLIAVSIMSLSGCLYVIGTYLYVPALRQHPAGIMFGMSVYGAVYQFLYLLEMSNHVDDCTTVPFLVDLCLTGQETYMLIFAIDLLLALKNPFTTSKGQMNYYHIAGCIGSVVFALLSRVDSYNALFGFCWMDSTAVKLALPLQQRRAAPAGIFFALYILLIYSISLYAILRTWNTLLKGLPDTFTTRRRIHRHLKYYVGCFVFYWTGVLITYAVYTFIAYDSAYKCQAWQFLSSVLLSKGMVNSIIWTRTSNILKIISQLRESGRVDLPPHDNSINWALRREILTFTTRGICESIERAEVQAIEGMGIDRHIKYTQIEEIILREEEANTVVFYDYAPHIFRYLRSCAQISNASYRDALQQTTQERVSEGKSGAFFYFTQDRKYLVKTLTHEELKFLLSILPKYVTFISAHPDTFVTRFVGCHALTMYGKTVFFIVMQSVFNTPLQIHERFDLKGSWVGRLEGRKTRGTTVTCKFCAKEYVIGGTHDQICDIRSNGGNVRHQYDNVGKDLNWNHHMKLPKPIARKVARQLQVDSHFLKQINCIDYSLLVGIHHRKFTVEAPLSPVGRVDSEFCGYHHPPFHQAQQGGMGVEEVYGPGVYFMGLIDILQQWNMRKRIEHFVRVYIFQQDKLGISVVKPAVYMDRFQKRVVKELIHDLHGESELQDMAEEEHYPSFSSSDVSSRPTRSSHRSGADVYPINDTFLSVDPVTPRSSMNLFANLSSMNRNPNPVCHFNDEDDSLKRRTSTGQRNEELSPQQHPNVYQPIETPSIV